jgi:ABC-type transport system involved in cytochrome bd biosynthesis fused ATPase/permease subunit
MKHSGSKDGGSESPSAPRLAALPRIGLTLLEALARISVPASVLLLSRGATAVAAATSAIAVLATVARGFATSFAVERSLRATFGAVVSAAQRLALVDLRAERKIGLLAEASREAAFYDATVVPQIGAHAIALVLTWAALIAVLGPLWALGLGLAAAPLVLGLGLGARRIRAEQEIAWKAFTDVAIDLRVLVEACVELRAHDRERSFVAGLVARARAFAGAERRANVWSAASAALPSTFVFLSAATPLGDRIAVTVANATGLRAAEIAIVAGASLYFALGLGKLLELRARYSPFRETLREFLAAPGAGLVPSSELASAALVPLPSLTAATLRFRDVSCRHAHAPRATPAHVEYTWPPGRGLLLAGENGAGKSTLVLALLGLIAPAEGAIELDGAALDRTLSRALRERCAYLAQSPFVEPGASVAWHLRLFARSPVDDARIDEALRRVGLWPVLVEHTAREAPGASLLPRDVLAGELSGGERQRMHLARLLVHDAELVVLDEPEAGLDRAARAEMAALFDELARERRVLLIAHDPAIVPSSFDRLDLRAERIAAP